MAEWTEEEFAALLAKVQAPFKDGFQWSDIPKVLKVSLEVVQDLGDLAKAERRDAAIALGRKVLEERLPVLLEEHDLAWVPDSLEKKWVDPWLLRGGLWAYDRFAVSLFTTFVDLAEGKVTLAG